MAVCDCEPRYATVTYGATTLEMPQAFADVINLAIQEQHLTFRQRLWRSFRRKCDLVRWETGRDRAWAHWKLDKALRERRKNRLARLSKAGGV